MRQKIEMRVVAEERCAADIRGGGNSNVVRRDLGSSLLEIVHEQPETVGNIKILSELIRAAPRATLQPIGFLFIDNTQAAFHSFLQHSIH